MMIELKNLVLESKGFSLKNVSLNVQKGSFHALIGPTGCGKTTLLESVLGLRKVKKGGILLEGKDITNLPVHKREFSYVPQDLAIFPHLTVKENIFYGIKHGFILNKDSRYKAGLQIAEQLGISNLLNRKALNLSGGERQRVALARALAPGHSYILLDEPLSALHEGLKREIWFLLKDLQQKYNLTILMVSHDLEETFFLSDFITVMIDGVIKQSDRKNTLYKNPSNIEVAKFFGIKNIFEADIEGREGEHYRLYCDELKTEIFIPISKASNPRKRVKFGIRSEDVVITGKDYPKEKYNLISGNVKNINQAGPTTVVIFNPSNSDKFIEIVLSEFEFEKLLIKPLMNLYVALKSEKLFLLE